MPNPTLRTDVSQEVQHRHVLPPAVVVEHEAVGAAGAGHAAQDGADVSGNLGRVGGHLLFIQERALHGLA